MLDPIERVFGGLWRLVAHTRERSDFVCGDCERVHRCGLPPSDNCIVRAAQIARNEDGSIKPYRRRLEFLGYF
jgi:hypothetical protein